MILAVAYVRPYNYKIYCTLGVVLLISVGFKYVCYSTYFIVNGIMLEDLEEAWVTRQIIYTQWLGSH